MMADKEGFDLLDIKGVDRKIQHLFSGVLREDEHGRLWVDYMNGDGKIIDQEVLSLSKFKFSSSGITHCSSANPASVRTIYISDSISNLIFFAQSYASRFTWEYSAFIATGAKLEKQVFRDAVLKFPFVKKHYTIYGHSLIGKISDCKIQHWLKGEDCLFRVDGEMVVANYHGKDFMLPVSEFSLRNHLRQLRIRHLLAALKPRHRVEGFNYLD